MSWKYFVSAAVISVLLMGCSGGGGGGGSSASSATTPGAPIISSVTAVNAQATVNFSAPVSDGGSAISSYTVISNTGQTATGAISPIIVSGLTNGTAYTFTVTATNSVGTGAVSTASNSVTPIYVAPTVPGAPTISSINNGNTQVTVNFVAPANNGGSAITGYTVTSNAGQIATGTSSPIIVTGLTNGTSYTFTVTATNSVGTSVASAASNSVTPTSASVPGAPTISSATAGNAQATVNFNAPVSNGGSAITGYTVTSNAGQVATGTSSPIIVTGLTNGTSYTFTATATNIAGTSAASTTSNSITPIATIPGAPTLGGGVKFSSGIVIGNAQVTVSFSPPTDNGGSSITSYTVTTNTGISATGTISPIIVTGLSNGTTYTVTVTATNTIGTSVPSTASVSFSPRPSSTNVSFPYSGTITASNDGYYTYLAPTCPAGAICKPIAPKTLITVSSISADVNPAIFTIYGLLDTNWTCTSNSGTTSDTCTATNGVTTDIMFGIMNHTGGTGANFTVQ